MNRAGFWIRAFPKRFRRVRGEELLATLEENEQRLTLRSVVDLVRAGWAERWRTHPPILRWIVYRFGFKLPSEYRAWMLDDLDGWIGARDATLRLVVAVSPGIVGGVLILLIDGQAEFLYTIATMVCLTASIGAATTSLVRKTILKRHGLDPLTREPLPGWFPDPSGVHEWRYWSGNGWTHYAADRGVTVEDPE